MLTKESSLRISLLRFPLIVGIVFIHAEATSVRFAGDEAGVAHAGFAADVVRNLISEGIARTAVPLFFLISGYLLLAGREWSRHTYLDKIRSRATTLLVPFLLWNIATLLVLALAQALPATQAYFSTAKSAIADYSVVDHLCAIFGIGRLPIAYQFWFIRDLMLLVLLSPIIIAANKRVPAVFMPILLSCWLVDFWPVSTPGGEPVLFFSAGCLLAARKVSLFSLDRFEKPIMAAYVVTLTADIFSPGAGSHFLFHKLDILIGVAAVLCITRLLAATRSLGERLHALAASSFFVFAAHEPLLTVCRKIAYRILAPTTSIEVLLLYFAIPACVIVALLLTNRFLSRRFPSFAKVITGGR